MEETDEGSGADDLAGLDAAGQRVQREPGDALCLIDVGGISDVVSAMGDEQEVLRVRCTDRRLESDEGLDGSGAPAGFFLHLAGRGDRRILVRVDVPTGEFRDPAVAAFGIRSTYCSNCTPSGSSTVAMVRRRRRVSSIRRSPWIFHRVLSAVTG